PPQRGPGSAPGPGTAPDPGRPGEGPGDRETGAPPRQEGRSDEAKDDTQAGSIGKAQQAVTSRAAEDEGEDRARDRHHDGVDERAQRVVSEVDEDVPPGVQGGLVVDKGKVEGAAVQLDGQLEGGGGDPVQR